MVREGKRYELLMDCVRHNLWAKEIEPSKFYNPNEFTGVRVNYKPIKPNYNIIRRIKNYLREKH